jgi:hypothetical protein
VSPFPTFKDEAALASNPFDTPQIWTDLTLRTRLRSWRRGRQTESDRPDTGRSSTTFENTDRALDNENAASVYAGLVLPMRRIRSRATLDGSTWYDLFTTFVDPQAGWQPVQEGPGYAEVVAAANDGFDVLQTAQFTELDSFPQQTVGQRINAILDRFTWPTGTSDGWRLGDATLSLLGTSTFLDYLPLGRSIEIGPTLVQAAPAGSLTGQSPLDQIQQAADTENGVFFFDERGSPVFHDRYHSLLATRAITSQATFVDHDNYAPGAPTTNLCPNPSFETNTTGWIANFAGATINDFSSSGGWSKFGTKSCHVKGTKDNTATGRSLLIAPSVLIPVTVGQAYSLSAYVKTVDPSVPTGIGVNAGYVMFLQWYDVTATSLGISAIAQAADEGVDGLRLKVENVVAPTGTVTCQIVIRIDSTSALDVIEFYVDGVQLEQGPVASAYCDGDQPGCSWAGVPHASQSVRGTTFLYASVTPSTSPVVNDYLITRAGGSQQEALDTVSIGLYRQRSKTLDTLHTSDLEVIDFGRYKVIATREPHRRYDEMTLTPGDDAAMWQQILTLGIGDRITVLASPPGGGAPDDRDMFIEAVAVDIGPGVNAQVVYRLSPGNQVKGWVLGDAINSILGTTTNIVY